MSAPLDRLIARVVDGRHDVRAQRPGISDPNAGALEEWPGEIDDEVVVAQPLRVASAKAEITAPEPVVAAPASGERDMISAREPRPTRDGDAPRPSPQPSRRDRADRPLSNDPVPPLAARVAPPEEAPVPVLLERHVATPVSRRAPSPSPRRAASTREQSRRIAPAGGEQGAADASTMPEPNQITVEIGRIEVAGPPAAPRRMLTLDAYLAARRDGTR